MRSRESLGLQRFFFNEICKVHGSSGRFSATEPLHLVFLSRAKLLPLFFSFSVSQIFYNVRSPVKVWYRDTVPK